ncbi:transglycosylase SLT domain-containing protein [Vibrio sp. Hal054]|uniref:transglycosylase SLT domain-containing protein n=1 Tax=Vibrio sp. Hal054 TaxID=3035158 RepID=UPI00301C19B8
MAVAVDMPTPSFQPVVSPTDSAYYHQLTRFDTERLPLFNCILYASNKINVHPDYIYTLVMAEGGTMGKYRRNKDGTHDMGIMQINYETWAVDLPRIGWKADWRMVLKNTCSNIELGTIIYQHRAEKAKDELTGLANYHWYSTAKNKGPHFTYKERIERILKDIRADKAKFASTGVVNGTLRCKYANCD